MNCNEYFKNNLYETSSEVCWVLYQIQTVKLNDVSEEPGIKWFIYEYKTLL